MSHALCVALLRPSCAALRPSAPIAHQWNTATQAFARRFCSRRSQLASHPRPSVFSVLRSHCSPASAPQFRSFTLTSYCYAKAEDKVPASASTHAARKRAVKIGQLPDGPVGPVTIRKLFGPRVSVVDGNNVLRILHHRRTSGSLVDYGVDNLGDRYWGVTHKHAVKALEWLREKYPVDEARAAEEWAEREANRIAYELWLADPENADSKYNDPARLWSQQQKELEEIRKEEEQRMGMLHVGRSQFELNIEEQRRARLEAQARKAEEEEKRQKEMQEQLATGRYVLTPSGKQVMIPENGQKVYIDIFGREQVSRAEEIKKENLEKAHLPFKSEEELLSATTLVQRLYPMTAFVFIVCLLCWGFGHYYEPPSPEYRLWPDVSLTTATISAIFGLNVIGCLLWRFPPAWKMMTRYFMHVPAYPRAFQAIGNVFSHVEYEHFLGNMMFLWLFGTACHNLVDRGIFVGTYVAGGAVGTLASLYWANLGRGAILAHAVGASACIYAISTLYLLLTDAETIKIPFIKDLEVAFWPRSLLAAYIGFECMIAFRKKGKSKADHASHFGGMAVGLSVGSYLHATGFHERRKRAAAQRGEAEGDKSLDIEKELKEEAIEIKDEVKKIIK
ncbi:uncharacterized protein EI97DRAFT_206206 [Westerdykella ornata]|uniref:Peptidase S54 rhomboid domain-containing protein n=1 Tax=Westerdykella ornata TaxID=318751 RepID=A0A6A6J844_WESOR|nr:uncharacterized protein EI97DRAFT_206206 [Westerdykella ornata]KAF2272582.1 hypothetical protein EI97DRAFT_206206 [Westerdykella ornata]